MTQKAHQHQIHPSHLIFIIFLFGAITAVSSERVKMSSDNRGFVLYPSGQPYIPWGHNYASEDILERIARDPARVEQEFAEMKSAKSTVARIHPEMPRILDGPD